MAIAEMKSPNERLATPDMAITPVALLFNRNNSKESNPQVELILKSSSCIYSPIVLISSCDVSKQ